MPLQGREAEVLTSGAERPTAADVTRWARGHRALAGSVVLAVLAGALAAALVAWPRAPAVPDISLWARPPTTPAPAVVPNPDFEVGVDVPPPPQTPLTWRLTLRWARPLEAGLTVMGVEGPGLTPVGTIVAPVGSRRVDVALTSTARCADVPVPVDVTAYGVRVEVTDGIRRSTGLVDSGPAAGDLAAAVESACGAWRTARDVGVTIVDATVSRTEPEVELRVTMVNRGSAPARLLAPSQRQNAPRGPITGTVVPAGGSSTVTVSLRIDDCPGPAVLSATNRPPAVDWLVATEAAQTAESSIPSWERTASAYGAGQVGVPWRPAAAGSFNEAVMTACAHVESVVLLVPTGGVRLDPGSGQVRVRALIDTPVGRVASVQLRTLPVLPWEAGDPTRYAPAWRRIGPLHPDRSGQVAVTLPYRAPARICPADGGWFPPFGADLGVRVGDVVRRVPIELIPDVSQDPHAATLLCPGGPPS